MDGVESPDAAPAASASSSSSPESSEELRSALTMTKGLSIFLDILRRADKNDDGKLSFDEFKAYFADGILSIEELHQLFQKIDIHNTEYPELAKAQFEQAKLMFFFYQKAGNVNTTL